MSVRQHCRDTDLEIQPVLHIARGAHVREERYGSGRARGARDTISDAQVVASVGQDYVHRDQPRLGRGRVTQMLEDLHRDLVRPVVHDPA